MTMQRLNRLIQEVYEQKYRAQLSELKQLQAQINPHFLYNSFFILSKMARESEDEHVYQFARALGSYYKFITRNSSELISLKEEWEHTRMYMLIQTYRFGNRIHADMEEVPAPFRDMQVPMLILQPLVENAYKYALEPIAGSGRIHIFFEEHPASLVIIIEDNGEQVDEEKIESIRLMLNSDEMMGETTAMINIHRRLRILFGPSSGLNIVRRPGGGLRVEMHIALEKQVNKSQGI